MPILKKVVAGLVILVVLVVAIAFLLPGQATVARSTVIAAAPEAVFPYMNDLRKFHQWSPWAARDPGMKVTFEGPDEGEGQKMSWQSDHPEVGSGSQEIIESVAGQSLTVALDFGEQGTAIAGFTLEPEGAGTKVTWGFEADLGYNPVMRYMGLMFDTWIGADYEKGLTSLKKLVEGQG